MPLTRRSCLLSKIESSYGVDPTPVASDALLISDLELRVDGELLTREFLRESLSPLAPRIGNKRVEVSFVTELKGGGAAGTAPRFGPLLRACGLLATTIASREVRYRPRSSSFESCTIYCYYDGLRHIVKGCRGTIDLNLEAGKAGRLTIKMEGLYTRPTDTAILTGSYDKTLPPIAKSVGMAIGKTTVTAEAVGTGDGATTVFSLDFGKVLLDTEVVRVAAATKTKGTDYHIDYHAGEITFLVAPALAAAITADYDYAPYAPVANGVQIALNNEFARRTDLNSTDFKAIEIDSRGSAGSFDPEAVTEATYAFWQKWEDSVEQGLALKIGTTAGQIIQVLAPGLVQNSMAWGDRDGYRIYDIPFTLTGDEKEFELCFK